MSESLLHPKIFESTLVTSLRQIIKVINIKKLYFFFWFWNGHSKSTGTEFYLLIMALLHRNEVHIACKFFAASLGKNKMAGTLLCRLSLNKSNIYIILGEAFPFVKLCALFIYSFVQDL